MNNQLRHPASLLVFCATEMWERYGFYIVQTLLVLYLTIFFSWSDREAYTLVGTFTAITYISPVIGGFIADHFIGQKRAIIIAAIILFLSYTALAIFNTDHNLAFPLAGIAVGTGLLKPNISSLLGNAYTEHSPYRESGFTLFYLGITAGIILGTTLPSVIQHHWGWPAAYLTGSLGMIIALMTFSYGVYCYSIQNYQVHIPSWKKNIQAALSIVGLYCGVFVTIYFPALANLLFFSIVLFSGYYIVHVAKKESALQAKKTLTIGLLCIISILFWAFYFQMFSSFTLLIERTVHQQVFGLAFPPPYYVTMESIGMLCLGFFLARRKQKSETSASIKQMANKFFIAMLLMLLVYTLVILILRSHLNQHLLSPLFFIPLYLIISLAELLLSPVGLSAITRLASPHRVSTMMGIFFVSLGIGGFLSGKLALLTAMPHTHLPLAILKTHYADAFLKIDMVLFAATVFSFFVWLVIKRLARRMH